jgi:hypothetical protein
MLFVFEQRKNDYRAADFFFFFIFFFFWLMGSKKKKKKTLQITRVCMSQSVLISSLVDEIVPHFQAQEDIASITKVKTLTQKATTSYDAQQRLIKELIQGMFCIILSFL